MSGLTIKAEVKGLREIQRNMEEIVRQMAGGPLLQAVRDSTLIVEAAAKKNAPWQFGRLRASITPVVTVEPPTIYGVVGSNVEYAAKMEKPGNVRKGGRRPYLRPALEENRQRIVDKFNKATRQIISRAGGR